MVDGKIRCYSKDEDKYMYFIPETAFALDFQNATGFVPDPDPEDEEGIALAEKHSTATIAKKEIKKPSVLKNQLAQDDDDDTDDESEDENFPLEILDDDQDPKADQKKDDVKRKVEVNFKNRSTKKPATKK